MDLAETRAQALARVREYVLRFCLDLRHGRHPLTLRRLARTTRAVVFMAHCRSTLLETSWTVTLRDVYYSLFEAWTPAAAPRPPQQTSNTAIADVQAALGCTRASLGVRASDAHNGLVFGPVELLSESGKAPDDEGDESMAWTHARTVQFDQGAVHIASSMVNDASSPVRRTRFRSSSARALLVVEKQCVFEHLLEEGLCRRLPSLVLATGLGFPSFQCRAFLRQLVDDLGLEASAVFALCDSDPHGVAIFLTYRLGSTRPEVPLPSWALPELRFLGVGHQDVDTAPPVPRVPFGRAEKALLSRMLADDDLEPHVPGLRQELALMQARGTKVEIEELYNVLVKQWLPSRLLRRASLF